jgi:cardiolipin synthase A/B
MRILRDLAVEALHAPRRRVIMTTPYFVPDEALLVALRLAAARGVRIDLIVPARSDQLIVGLAGQFFCEQVIEHGIHVHLYQRSLIHVKAMTVDEGFATLGTANFEIRSFYLNFELNLLSYDADLNALLRSYQSGCIRDSKELNLSGWRDRGILQQWGAQFAKLLRPLL